LIHLYALARGPLREPVVGIEDAPVRSVPFGEVHAVVSSHRHALATTREAALRHLTVIEAVTEHLDVLPVRFGPGHEDEDSLRTKLEGEAGLLAALDRVAGRVEFMVRSEATPAPAGNAPAGAGAAGAGAAAAGAVPSGAAGPGAGDAGSPGRAYLEGRRAADRAAAERDAEALEGLRSATRALDPAATAVLETTGRNGPERCFLVPRSAAEAFAARARRHVASSTTLVVGGPWPPFTFASLPTSAEGLR
jgi:hypothetical protein